MRYKSFYYDYVPSLPDALNLRVKGWRMGMIESANVERDGKLKSGKEKRGTSDKSLNKMEVVAF